VSCTSYTLLTSGRQEGPQADDQLVWTDRDGHAIAGHVQGVGAALGQRTVHVGNRPVGRASEAMAGMLVAFMRSRRPSTRDVVGRSVVKVMVIAPLFVMALRRYGHKPVAFKHTNGWIE
jgi:hypothetical protein